MRFLLILSQIFFLLGCSQQDQHTLVVGTIDGPETALVETAKEVAYQQYGLKIKIVPFNDYNLPNRALQDGSLDANIYQHLPYLKAAMKAHGYDLEVIGKTFVYPTGIYSVKHKDVKQIPKGATIAIPNDPSNEARALILLQSSGLITLKSGDALLSVKDIDKNPKKLKFKTLDAAQLPRVLQDVDVAVINTNFAIPAGLNPLKDALFTESKDSPYANLIVIKKNSKKRKQLAQLVKALNSPEVKTRGHELFGDAAIPAW